MSKPGAEAAEQTAPAPVVYQFAKRPKEISFCQFVYNNETGEILGRTPISWCKCQEKSFIFSTFLSCSQDHPVLHHLLFLLECILHRDAPGILPHSRRHSTYLEDGVWRSDWLQPCHGLQTWSPWQSDRVNSDLVQVETSSTSMNWSGFWQTNFVHSM